MTVEDHSGEDDGKPTAEEAAMGPRVGLEKRRPNRFRPAPPFSGIKDDGWMVKEVRPEEVFCKGSILNRLTYIQRIEDPSPFPFLRAGPGPDPEG